jgi:large subunit ribosomal protein L17
MLRNLATSAILYEKIKTTRTRAMKLKGVIEKLITAAKKNTPANALRYLNAYLLDKNASNKLVRELLQRYKEKSSGFVRVTKLGTRAGDAADMAQIELL